MSVFSKKFEALLAKSPMFRALAAHAEASNDYANAMAGYVTRTNERLAALESKVTTLEGQVNVLASTTRSLMETVTQLSRGYTTNRKAIEELYSFVTDPEPNEESSIDSDEQISQEEILAYKKTLN